MVPCIVFGHPVTKCGTQHVFTTPCNEFRPSSNTGLQKLPAGREKMLQGVAKCYREAKKCSGIQKIVTATQKMATGTQKYLQDLKKYLLRRIFSNRG